MMSRHLLIAGSLFVPLAFYACSSDDTDDGGDQTSNGGQNQAGSTARGGSSTGRTSGGAAGRSATTSSGGTTTSATGGAITTGNGGANAGAAATGVAAGAGASGANVGGVAGNSLGSAGAGTKGGSAGSSSGGAIATGPSGGKSGSGGGAAGRAGSATTVLAGASSTPGGAGGTGGATSTVVNAGSAGTAAVSCDPLCGGTSCATQPACLELAYGIGTGGELPICIPSMSALSGTVLLCGDTTCGGVAGCSMVVHFGTTTWAVGTPDATSTSSLVVNTVVTAITGELGVTSTALPMIDGCKLAVGVPTEGVAATANGAVKPASGGSALLGLNFDAFDAALSGISATSDNTTCAAMASAYLITPSSQSTFRTALLEAVNARAARMSCLACRDDCPQQIACTAP